jgi:hypothetical protein
MDIGESNFPLEVIPPSGLPVDIAGTLRAVSLLERRVFLRLSTVNRL